MRLPAQDPAIHRSYAGVMSRAGVLPASGEWTNADRAEYARDPIAVTNRLCNEGQRLCPGSGAKGNLYACCNGDICATRRDGSPYCDRQGRIADALGALLPGVIPPIIMSY